MTTHKHHIIPKHEWKERFGFLDGVDDPENVVYLTSRQHAEVHKLLFEQHGRWQDKLAWHALSGHIGKEEIIKQLQSTPNIGRKLSEKSRNQISKKLIGSSLSEEHKKRISTGVVNRYSNQDFREKQRNAASKPGDSNPFYGKRHSDEFKKRQSIRRSKHYICVSPNGESFNVFNLSEFCKRYDLNRGNMGAGGTKGWTCKRRII